MICSYVQNILHLPDKQGCEFGHPVNTVSRDAKPFMYC